MSSWKRYAVYAVLLTANILFLMSERHTLSVYNDDTIQLKPSQPVTNRAASSITKWPPLEDLIDPMDDTISGIKSDVSFLLDIAILGHAKCATSFLVKWLQQHPETALFSREVCDLDDRKPAKLVRRLYTEFPQNDNTTTSLQRGFKCPGHFSNTPLSHLATFFPRTKLIVGLRHPVKYFESYYNFRARHPQRKSSLGDNTTLPPAETLIGPCPMNSQGVCTDRARFHVNLAKLGKTNWTDPEEQRLLHLTRKQQHITVVPNPLFLYDMDQLYDANAKRREQFRTDLKDFLGLSTPLPPLTVPPSTHKKFKALDICLPLYDELRAELIESGARASRWIRDFLLSMANENNVTISSPEYFESILRTWKYDPCDERNTNNSTASSINSSNE